MHSPKLSRQNDSSTFWLVLHLPLASVAILLGLVLAADLVAGELISVIEAIAGGTALTVALVTGISKHLRQWTNANT